MTASTCHQMWSSEDQWKSSSRLKEHPLPWSENKRPWWDFTQNTSLLLMYPFTWTGSGEYPLHRKLFVTMGLTEIWVVLLSSFTKSVMGLKWTTALLQTPWRQGLRVRSNTQEDRDRSAPNKPSEVKRPDLSCLQWLQHQTWIDSFCLSVGQVLTLTCAKLQRQRALLRGGGLEAWNRNRALNHQLILSPILRHCSRLWYQLCKTNRKSQVGFCRHFIPWIKLQQPMSFTLIPAKNSWLSTEALRTPGESKRKLELEQ